MVTRQFVTTPADGGGGRVIIAVPFDPNTAWGHKTRHHVAGVVGGRRVRGVIEPLEGIGFGFVLGPAWSRDCGIALGEEVTVEIAPEGPQRSDLDDDIAAALDADPGAGEFFDSLAQFYRRAYLRWIDGTKRRPAERARRIAELVELLRAGQKQRPTA